MNRLKKVAKEILIASLILFVLSNIISYIRKPNLDSSHLPNIEVILLNGSTFKPNTNKPIVIHFWATWCPTCKLEADNIERIAKNYQVLTIAVNSGENKKIQAYMQERGLTFNVLNDNKGTWATQFKVQAYPTTFIYDSKSELRFSEVGYTTSAGLLARLKMIE